MPLRREHGRLCALFEIVLFNLLATHLESGDVRFVYYEAEGCRKAREIDPCWDEIARLREGRGEGRRAA